MDWAATRADFPTLSRKTYLNTCSLGLLSRQSRAAVGTFLDLWEEHGASAWYRIWLGEVQALREKFARLVHARPDEVAILPNVSSALGVLASTDPPGGGYSVASAEMDFPTIPYQWAQRKGVQVRLAKSADGIRTPVEAYAPLVDRSTRWVATSHVFYTSGFQQDVPGLAKLARDNGAMLLLDAYQGTGQLPTDVRALGCDAYVTGGLKWLLGGPGVSFLWVKRELHDTLAPASTGWFAHAEQFKFDSTSFTPHADARRFETGTPATAAVYAASAGLDVLHKLGPDAVARRAQELARDLSERLVDAGYSLAAPEDARERTAIVPVRLADPATATKALADERIIVDYRPGRIRVSPYFYNTTDENERFVESLRKIAPP